MKKRTLILSLLLCCAILGLRSQDAGFITLSANRLSDGGKTFYINGANCTYDGRLNRWGNQVIDDWFRLAAQNGMNCVRVFACGEGVNANDTVKENGRVYQVGGPGNWYEPAFKSTDYALYCARKYNVRIVFTLLTHTQGSQRYGAWAGVDEGAFWSNSTCKGYYKNYVNRILNRVNTYTGIAYKNDPYILAWEPGNEVDISTDSSGKGVDRSVLDSWIWEMAAYIKSIDSNHLVCSGAQGGYELRTNGTKWKATHNNPNIDICSFHNYPLEAQPNQTRVIVEPVMIRAISLAKELGKAVFMGEYGISDSSASSLGYCSTEEKERWYRWFGNYATGFDLDGMMFWCWYRPDNPTSGGSGVNPTNAQHSKLRTIVSNICGELALRSGKTIVHNSLPKAFTNVRISSLGSVVNVEWEVPAYSSGAILAKRYPLTFELRYDNVDCTWGEMRRVKRFVVSDPSQLSSQLDDIYSDGVSRNYYYLSFRDGVEEVYSLLSNKVSCLSAQNTSVRHLGTSDISLFVESGMLRVVAPTGNAFCTVRTLSGDLVGTYAVYSQLPIPLPGGVFIVSVRTEQESLTKKVLITNYP